MNRDTLNGYLTERGNRTREEHGYKGLNQHMKEKPRIDQR